MNRKRPHRAARGGAETFQAGPGTVVSLSYELSDAEGELVEASEPGTTVDVLLGYGDAAPAVERALEGLSAGASREILLAAEDAFGPRDPDALIVVERSELPPGLALGDELDAERYDGGGHVTLKVVDLTETTATLDTNHPLSGQRVRLGVFVERVRPATEEEILAASARLLGRGPATPEPLLPAERLLRRRAAPDDGGGKDPPPPPKRVA